uniref:Uncharacterized protein LOC114346452 n=1 Tax=Diabrotica virgifera virgifera TaxID=50390 RepID=A0A6P7H5K3_DIAVI
VNTEEIAISTKTLFGVPQNFVVENISSKNIVENTEIPTKASVSFSQQDLPFVGEPPCLKDQCTDPKSADKKISYTPPVYSLIKPQMVDKESNYETRRVAFGDYIKDPKDNVVACYVVNTPVGPFKPTTQDKGSPPTMKDESTCCSNNKCADLEQPPCGGLEIPCGEVEADEDVNTECETSEEPPCKYFGTPCCKAEAKEDINNKCEESEEAPCKYFGSPCCEVKANEETIISDTKQDLPLGEKIDFDDNQGINGKYT